MSPTQCPKCNADRNASDLECPSCGIVYVKYEKIQQKKSLHAARRIKIPQAFEEKQKPDSNKAVSLAKYMIIGVVCLYALIHFLDLEKVNTQAPMVKPVVTKPQPTEAEKAALAAKRKKEIAERERQKRDEYERCKIDLQCWGEKHSLRATFASQKLIEKLAKYDFEWVDGFLGSKFSKARWLDESEYTLVYFGDQIKLQNGFGAWQRHIYRVEYDPTNEKIIDVTVTPGRL